MTTHDTRTGSETAVEDEVRPWPLGSYAPGNYSGKCLTCENEFTGDKRALSCLECAIVRLKAHCASLQDDLARTERNRDMWKGQVHRQSASLSKMRDLLAPFASIADLTDGVTKSGKVEVTLEKCREIRDVFSLSTPTQETNP